MRSRETEKATELALLRKQNHELKALNATKDEFIALASHQLRTPATAVKQYLGMLLEGYMGELAKAQLEFIQKAYDNNERQINTINDLLHVAQIDADKIVLHRETCNLMVLLEAVVSEFQGIIKNRRQQLVLLSDNTESLTYADPLRLRMAIDNLVDNASKYSNESTQITVSLRTESTSLFVSVTDLGVGIAEFKAKLAASGRTKVKIVYMSTMAYQLSEDEREVLYANAAEVAEEFVVVQDFMEVDKTRPTRLLFRSDWQNDPRPYRFAVRDLRSEYPTMWHEIFLWGSGRCNELSVGTGRLVVGAAAVKQYSDIVKNGSVSAWNGIKAQAATILGDKDLTL